LEEAMAHSRWTNNRWCLKASPWLGMQSRWCRLHHDSAKQILVSSQYCQIPCIYAFNNYWKKFKKNVSTSYFNAAAIVTDLDPSILLTWLLKDWTIPSLTLIPFT
jgi:hypothetical protein